MSTIIIKEHRVKIRFKEYILQYLGKAYLVTYYTCLYLHDRVDLEILEESPESIKRGESLAGETITSKFSHYFLDWLHPTEEEFIAFCLEHDLEY